MRLRVVEEKHRKALVKAFVLGGDEGEKARMTPRLLAWGPHGWSQHTLRGRLGGPRNRILPGWVHGAQSERWCHVFAEGAGPVPAQAPGPHSGLGWGTAAPCLHRQVEWVAGSLWDIRGLPARRYVYSIDFSIAEDTDLATG